MRGKRIIMLLGIVFALALIVPSVLVAAENENSAKRIEGTWVMSSGAGVLIQTCIATKNASAKSFSCTYTDYYGDEVLLLHEDGVFTGPGTFQSTAMSYYSDPTTGWKLIIVNKLSGIFRDENTYDEYTRAFMYLDVNENGLADENIFIGDLGPAVLVTAHRMVTAAPELPFPEYPEP